MFPTSPSPRFRTRPPHDASTDVQRQGARTGHPDVLISGTDSTTLESVAFAGMDLPVHIALGRTGTDGRVRYDRATLSYPQFQRMLREKGDRCDVIELLKNLGNQALVDPVSGHRCWAQVHCRMALRSAPLPTSINPASLLTKNRAA